MKFNQLVFKLLKKYWNDPETILISPIALKNPAGSNYLHWGALWHNQSDPYQLCNRRFFVFWSLYFLPILADSPAILRDSLARNFDLDRCIKKRSCWRILQDRRIDIRWRKDSLPVTNNRSGSNDAMNTCTVDYPCFAILTIPAILSKSSGADESRERRENALNDPDSDPCSDQLDCSFCCWRLLPGSLKLPWAASSILPSKHSIVRIAGTSNSVFD